MDTATQQIDPRDAVGGFTDEHGHTRLCPPTPDRPAPDAKAKPATVAKGKRKAHPAKKKPARGRRPEVVETKTTFWCRPHNRMEPKTAFAKSFLKRGDHRCSAAFKEKYAGRYAKPKAAKKARKK
jgi:hypothetical protein